MWGQGIYGAQILILVHKCTFKVVGGHFFHRLSLLLNIKIEKKMTISTPILKLAPPLNLCIYFFLL